MPSQKIIDRLNHADPETKLDILDEHADSVMEEKSKKIQKTAEKQYSPLDKLYMALLVAAKNNALQEDTVLTDAEKYDLGIRGRNQMEQANPLDRLGNRLAREAIDSLIKEPPTLQDYEIFHATLGMIKAKAAHDLAKTRDEIHKELPGDLDEQTKDGLADYLVTTVTVLPSRIYQAALNMLNELSERPFTQDGQELDYSEYRNKLLKANFKAEFNKPGGRNMTVREFWALAKMSEDDQAIFLEKTKCSADDKVFDVYYRTIKAAEEKKGTVFTSDEEARNKLQNKVIELISLRYATKVVDHWQSSGAERYEKGLQGAETKLYQKGKKLQDLQGKKLRSFREEMNKNIPNLKTFDDQFSRKYFLKDVKQIDAYLLSEKSLKMREQPGISEIFSTGNANYTERIFVTKGALQALEGAGTVWKHHSKNSVAFDKMLTAIKDYHQALAANEGGKAIGCRSKMCKAIKNYIEDKYAKRRSPEGQVRFNTVLTLLYEEMTPEEFGSLLEDVNAKRGETEKISLEALKSKKESFILDAKNREKEAQEATKDFATAFPNRYGSELAELDTTVIPEPGESFPAIGLRGNEMLETLSNRDYTAIAYTCALSAPKKNDLLINDNLLQPSEEQIADGRRRADAALRAYGQGNKQPLGALLSAALRKTGREIKNRPAGTEKVVMTEIGARIKNMLERDPELKKYAMRSGLQESELEPAPAAEAESNYRNKTTEKELDNPIILS